MNWRRMVTASLLATAMLLLGVVSPALADPRTSPPANMVLVGAGEFQMGDAFYEGASNELPVHAVYLDPYYIDQYETTNTQYCAYLNSAYAQGLIEVTNDFVYKAGGGGELYCGTYAACPLEGQCSRIHFDNGTFTITPGKEDHPLLAVSWYGAVAYANWRSEQSGRAACYDLNTWTCNFAANGYRLPTEAEWEKAAGWDPDQQRHFRFGCHSDGAGINSLDSNQANYMFSGDPWDGPDFPNTTPVGYYDGSDHGGTYQTQDGQSYYGCYDMSGNVWEWCNDWYLDVYYSSSPYDNPKGPDSGTTRVYRGGAWSIYPYLCRSAVRGGASPTLQSNLGGFRCAVSATWLVGDMNCDGAVNNQDIDPFVLALFSPAGYAQQYPGCDILNGDFTGDGFVNNQDIDGFVAALFGN